MARSRDAPGRRGHSLKPSQEPKGGWHPVEWACELVGTFILVLVGLSAVVFDFGGSSPVANWIPSHSARLLVTGLVFAGGGSLVAISPLGRRSGAHLNPSVTLAFWCQRHLTRGDVAGYVISQCAGAIAAAAVIRLAWGSRARSVNFGVTLPKQGLGVWEAAGIEALMTAVLIFTIYLFVSSKRTARWTPMAVWIVVAILVWQGAPYTGTSLNLARSLGPRLVSVTWTDFWIYIVGPLAGAGAAAAIWIVVPRSTLTAKLFHDPRYRSILGSKLPVSR